jgi:hypothetical protein
MQELEARRAEQQQLTAQRAACEAEVEQLRVALAAAELRLTHLMRDEAGSAQRVAFADAAISQKHADARTFCEPAVQALQEAQQQLDQLLQQGQVENGTRRLLESAKAEILRRQQSFAARKQALQRRSAHLQAEHVAGADLVVAAGEHNAAELCLQAANTELGQAQQALIACEERCTAAARQLYVMEEQKQLAVAVKDFKTAASLSSEAKAVAGKRDAAEQECALLKAHVAASADAVKAATQQVHAASIEVASCRSAVTRARLDMLHDEIAALEDELRVEALGMTVDWQPLEKEGLQSRLDLLRAELKDLSLAG